jgi:hypothetical protein
MVMQSRCRQLQLSACCAWGVVAVRLAMCWLGQMVVQLRGQAMQVMLWQGLAQHQASRILQRCSRTQRRQTEVLLSTVAGSLLHRLQQPSQLVWLCMVGDM